MAIEKFPPVELADENGLIAIGGDLEVESLLLAYRSGIFPWPVFEDDVLAWFSPPERAVLFFDEIHIGRSLKRSLRQTSFSFQFDRDLEKTITLCADSTNREGPPGTWITEEILKAYLQFNQAGYCHSVEAYEKERLVGGLYGVSIGAMFAGESLFYLEPNASKMCLCALVSHLWRRGGGWLDCQQMTPLLESFGAREIPRADFLDLLSEAVNKDITLVKPSEKVLSGNEILEILTSLENTTGDE